MAESSVYIVIVNWNGWKDTIECLGSLLKINYQNYQIIVVDNHSEDESYEKISGWCKNKNSVTILQSGGNLGFAGGSNIGIRYALNKHADHVLLLNNDTTVAADFLSHLVNTTEADKEIGIVTGKILHTSDMKIWYLGGKLSWLRGGGYHPKKGRTDKEKTVFPPFEVDFISGCAMLIKREVFEKIGLLDESYFLYNEDADYCLRASRAGVIMMVDPKAIIYHKENSTLGGWKPYHIYYLIRNKLIFMKRFAPNTLSLLIFYAVAISIGITLSIKWALQNRFDLVSAYTKALYDFGRRCWR